LTPPQNIFYIYITLDREFEFYVDNQTELVKKYNGRFLVIHNKEVFGDYATLREAYFLIFNLFLYMQLCLCLQKRPNLPLVIKQTIKTIVV